jgi:NADPH-dependent ferric siderophore reductase
MSIDVSGALPQGGSGQRRPGRGGGGRRRPPQPVEVVSVSQVTARLVSVRVTGGDLSRFGEAPPTSHIKVFLPAPGQDAPVLPTVTADGERVWPDGESRPVVRTYTPRSFDPETGALEIQFALHGEGPAADWAQHARPGAKLAISGPGGRFAADLNAPRWWIAGDESALPAVGTLLDALPSAAIAEVHLEVTDAADEIPLDSQAKTIVTWHYRRGPGAFGVELYDAAASAAIADGTAVWVACEATAMRRIRRQLIDGQRVPHSALVTRGYWRVGEADHPDHDYGED